MRYQVSFELLSGQESRDRHYYYNSRLYFQNSLLALETAHIVINYIRKFF